MRILLFANKHNTINFLKGKNHLIDLVTNSNDFFDNFYLKEYNLIAISLIDNQQNISQLIDEIKEEKVNIPIVLLSKADSIDTQLECAGNYCFYKSFKSSDNHLSLGNLSFDITQRCFLVDDQTLHLALREFTLLEQLFFNHKSFVSKEKIMRLVLKDASSTQSNLPEVYLYRLRTKLKQCSARVKIITHRYLGYQIVSV
jgi:DNA-binding response OmpR family regulator